jgi:hypothetical protein
MLVHEGCTLAGGAAKEQQLWLVGRVEALARNMWRFEEHEAGC